jgi:hypothetical protein
MNHSQLFFHSGIIHHQNNLHFTGSNLSTPAHTKKHSRRFCFRTVHCWREQWHPMQEIANGQVMWPASGRAKQSSRAGQPGSRNKGAAYSIQGTAAREQKSGRCIQHTVHTWDALRLSSPSRRAALVSAHPGCRWLEQRPLHTVSPPMDLTKVPSLDLRL